MCIRDSVLKGDNYVFISPDLLENKFIVKKGDVIKSAILGKSDLNFKEINLKIKSLLRETRDEIKSKGSQVAEINTNGNFVKKIRDFLKNNQNTKFELEVVSLRDSKGLLKVNPPLGRALIEDALLRFLLKKDYELETGHEYKFTISAKF